MSDFAGQQDPDGHLFHFADGRTERHRVKRGSERWMLYDRDGVDGEGLPRFLVRAFLRREFADGQQRWFEFFEEDSGS